MWVCSSDIIDGRFGRCLRSIERPMDAAALTTSPLASNPPRCIDFPTLLLTFWYGAVTV